MKYYVDHLAARAAAAAVAAPRDAAAASASLRLIVSPAAGCCSSSCCCCCCCAAGCCCHVCAPSGVVFELEEELEDDEAKAGAPRPKLRPCAAVPVPPPNVPRVASADVIGGVPALLWPRPAPLFPLPPLPPPPRPPPQPRPLGARLASCTRNHCRMNSRDYLRNPQQGSLCTCTSSAVGTCPTTSKLSSSCAANTASRSVSSVQA